jgi:hypothetical protein
MSLGLRCSLKKTPDKNPSHVGGANLLGYLIGMVTIILFDNVKARNPCEEFLTLYASVGRVHVIEHRSAHGAGNPGFDQ